MAQDRPSAVNLLETVSQFLRELMPRVEGADRFHTRVSIHLLDLVARELRDGAKLDAAEHERLSRLLGTDGSLETLNAELARAIRAGELDDRHAETFEHVLRTVEDKLSVVNPTYAERAGAGS